MYYTAHSPTIIRASTEGISIGRTVQYSSTESVLRITETVLVPTGGPTTFEDTMLVYSWSQVYSYSSISIVMQLQLLFLILLFEKYDAWIQSRVGLIPKFRVWYSTYRHDRTVTPRKCQLSLKGRPKEQTLKGTFQSMVNKAAKCSNDNYRDL